jgi:hypothetical protein
MSNKRDIPSTGISSPAKQNNTKKGNTNSTPVKFNCEKIDEEHSMVPQYGQDDWCGARDKCKNSLRAATSEYVCTDCNYCVLSTCFLRDLCTDGLRCTWCYDLYDTNNQEQQNQTMNSNEYDKAYQSDPVLTTNRMVQEEDEIEIEFSNNDDLHLDENFPNDTSAIQLSTSFEVQPSITVENNAKKQESTNTPNKMKNDTTEIIQDHCNTEMDTSVESKQENDINADIVQDLVTKILQANLVTPTSTDDIVHALANITNTTIVLETIDNQKALKYIDYIKQWFQNETNGKNATAKNKYKIIAKYLEIPVKNKKKANKDKLNKTRNDIIKVFIDRPYTLMQKNNLQQISKVSGIFFGPETISTNGKNQVIQDATNKVQSGKAIFSTNDVPSFEKLQEFITIQQTRIAQTSQKVVIPTVQPKDSSEGNKAVKKKIIQS